MRKFLYLKTCFIFIIATCLYSVNAFSSFVFVTGNDIYDTCSHLTDKSASFKTTQDMIERSMNKGRDIGMCYAAVGTAFSAVTEVGYLWAVDEEFVRCMEKYYGFDKISGQQLLDMTIQYLKNNPKYRNLTITTVMMAMLHDEFPASVCGASSPLQREKSK